MIEAITERTVQQRTSLVELVLKQMEPLFVRLRRARIIELCAHFSASDAADESGSGWRLAHGLRFAEINAALALIRDLRRQAERERNNLTTLEAQLAQAENETEERFLIQRFVDAIAAEHAFIGKRHAHSDDFDIEALQEGIRRGWSRREIDIEIALGAIGAALREEIAHAVANQEYPAGPIRYLLDGTSVFTTLESMLSRDEPWRLRVAAIEAMRGASEAMPASEWPHLFPAHVYGTLSSICYHIEDHPWVQVAALRAIHACDAQHWIDIVDARLEDGMFDATDDLFVRHTLIKDLAYAQDTVRARSIIVRTLDQRDSSDHVRVGAVMVLARHWPVEPNRVLFERVLGIDNFGDDDQCVQVRTGLVVAMLEAVGHKRPANDEVIFDLIIQVLDYEQETTPLRAIADLLPDAILRYARSQRPDHPEGASFLNDTTERILKVLNVCAADRSYSVALRRYFQACREAIIVPMLPAWRRCHRELIAFARRMRDGDIDRFPIAEHRLDARNFGRMLAHLAREDFGFSSDAQPLAKVQKGDRFVTRLWRWLHELRNPHGQKRQGFFHCLGRTHLSPIIAHSGLLGETAPTGVPGEPVFNESEGQWRRFLPLLDDLWPLVRIMGGQHQIMLFSDQGMTTITGPATAGGKLRLRAALTLRFAALSRLRNEPLAPSNPNERHAFVRELKRLDCSITFHPAGWVDQTGEWHTLNDPSLTSYFGPPVIEAPSDYVRSPTAHGVPATEYEPAESVTTSGELQVMMSDFNDEEADEFSSLEPTVREQTRAFKPMVDRVKGAGQSSRRVISRSEETKKKTKRNDRESMSRRLERLRAQDNEKDKDRGQSG